jgi:hypothetical protein
MIHTTNNKDEGLYEFRGKQFTCDADTIRRLNYALALNDSDERYVAVGNLIKENDGGDK